ncbi:unnamed protein product [Clavelina lepadiformis]|uniref:Ubiquitin conjugation factor E4 A n=1 Tax=Clavelina lepadiformis TaxID=159417 RepID=A0ABP0F630_CLALP
MNSDQLPIDNSVQISKNPFAELFPSLTAAESFSQENQNNEFEKKLTQKIVDQQISWKQSVNDLLERIFLVTLSSDDGHLEKSAGNSSSVPPCCVYMSEFADRMFLDQSEIDQILFERLLLDDKEIQTRLIHRKQGKWNVSQNHSISYLLRCYQRLEYECGSCDYRHQPVICYSREIVVRNLSTALLNPEMYEHIKAMSMMGTSLHEKLYYHLEESSYFGTDTLQACFADVVRHICNNSATTAHDDLTQAFNPLLQVLYNKVSVNEVTVADAQLMDILNVISILTSTDDLTCLLIEFKAPNIARQPSSLATILGSILGKSCLISNPQETEHLFFNDLYQQTQQGADDEESRVHGCMESIHSKLHDISYKILHFKRAREKYLIWIGELLHQHSNAARMWLHEHYDPKWSVFPSDAIFINLASVLVRLSLPFCIHFDNGVDKITKSSCKFLNIDPTYCKATGRKDRLDRGVHMDGLHKETCLVKEEDSIDVSNLPSKPCSFITECFFMAHRSLQIGMHGLLTKFYRLNKELNRLRSNNQERELFQRAMAVYLSSKALLTEPEFVKNLGRFQITTACYLNQLAFSDDRSKFHEIKLPCDSGSAASFHHIPEFIVENLADYIVFLRRFKPLGLENLKNSVQHILQFVIMYMGNKARMTNPHLRASLAEVLEAALPLQHDELQVNIPTSCREESFRNFPDIGHLAIAVIQLFVDIEFTGDPQQFEQKFDYRRPLYPILKFLWETQEGREAVKDCAVKALVDIENPLPPLLLSFINLFLNDAIFLLDGAIDVLKEIKADEEDRNSGKWEELSEREKQEKEVTLRQNIMIARFHNFMSNETVHVFTYLTSEEEVRKLLSHKVLVDRIASMLDYFLQYLVGPKMRELKIQDFSHCEFKPKQLVYEICLTFSNLRRNVDFCHAIANDERSYDQLLFPRALHVLQKIGHSELCSDIQDLSQSVKALKDKQDNLEELYQDAPEEFFDPLMGTLMQDPVILPVSKITVDRSTIARHLLSDHTDPFNRSPLTMEEVTTNVELYNKIKKWMKDRN